MSKNNFGLSSFSPSPRTALGPACIAADGPNASVAPLQFLTALSAQGDVVPYDTPYGHAYLINHPDHIRRVFQSGNYLRGSLIKIVLGEGLLASEGVYWRQQRHLMQPAFHPQSVARLDAIMTRASAEMLGRWQKFARSGQPIDVQTEMVHLTLNIIARALFSVYLKDSGALAEAVQTIVADIGQFASTLFGKAYRIEPTRNRQVQAGLQTVNRIVQGMIDERCRSDEKIDDLLSLLLSYRETETGKGLNARQVRDEVVTMLLAGHVTTANMLTWACYLVSRHFDVETRLHDELSRVLDGRLPCVKDLPNLRCARTILQETLRLYPPVWFIPRAAVKDDEIGGCRIPANTTVIVSPYLMHRHPIYWERPEQFEPQRFTETWRVRHPYSYLPFAAGPHICIGTHLALLEGQLVLAMINQRYRLRLHASAVEPEPALTLRVRDSLPMTIEPR